MSSVEIIKLSELTVYLMEINENQLPEYFNDLTAAEKTRLESIHHPAKRHEFLASRSLRTQLFGLNHIHYTEVGAPYIENEGFISISHTTNLVGIACSSAFRVGVDLEFIKDKAVKLSPRFVNDSEKQLFDVSDPCDMSLLWSFKETLFKLAGRKGILWAKDLIVGKNEHGYTGTILGDGPGRQYQLAVSNFQHYLVTCNTTDATLIY